MNPVVPSLNRSVSFQAFSREELELRVQELTDFVENASLPLHWVDSKGIIIWANQAELDMLGYTAEEYIGSPISHFHADRLVIENILTRLANNETLHNYPARLRCKDGSVKHVLINSNVFRKEGEFIHTRCFTRDITVLKQAEERSARLAAIVESSEDAIISKTLDGIITSWNKAAERIFGYTENEVLGRPITILIPKDRLQEEELIIGKITKGESVDHYETYRLTKEAAHLPVALTISPVKDATGIITGASKIVRDITKQKLFEANSQRHAEHLEALNTIGRKISELLEIDEILQEVIDATVLVTGASFGAFFYLNNQQKHGLLRSVKFGGTDKKIFENFYTCNLPLFNSLISDDTKVETSVTHKKARHEINVQLSALMENTLPFAGYLIIPLISRNNGDVGVMLYGYSKGHEYIENYESLLTAVAAQASVALEKAELYEEIRRLNNKKDEFIGLASHELKTPVTSLQGYLQIVHRRLPDKDENKEFLQKALNQAGKLSRLISDLLDVSKIESGQLTLNYSTFDLIPFLKDLIDLLQFAAKTHRIVLKANVNHLTISADKIRIEQVVTNLISNAIKYSPKADLVELSVSTCDPSVVIAVQDFGIGIKKENQEQVFSRFYRVEELAGHMSGLGLGLFISREIISRHHGKLWLKSEPEKGSIFSFKLPLTV
ncbi:PAS domain S-box protein [Desertivirga xinjiangensis]|uniref:PAS domain S-box protein n=1 Tax=Desertivirga xinjiangensis TaxID=539206 RepID=UPI00210D8F83|nr:PAS domain S-box protein [Pedobacter xinjiangensis]